MSISKIGKALGLAVCSVLVFVYASPGQAAISLSEFVEFSGEGDEDHAGYAQTTGDINGDGYIDVVVGVPYNEDGGMNCTPYTRQSFYDELSWKPYDQTHQLRDQRPSAP